MKINITEKDKMKNKFCCYAANTGLCEGVFETIKEAEDKFGASEEAPKYPLSFHGLFLDHKFWKGGRSTRIFPNAIDYIGIYGSW